MEIQNLSVLWGIASFIASVVLLAVVFLQHRTIASLIVAFQMVNTNPALITAIQGATENIPQDAFNKALAVLSAARSFAPTEELKALDDQAANFVKEIDHDVSNDSQSATPPQSLAAAIPLDATGTAAL